MEAKILPLEGKYYGTRVALQNEPKDIIEIWVNGDYEPSEREYDFKADDGKYYVRYDDGDVGEYEISDTHYETALSYKIAQILVEALKEVGS